MAESIARGVVHSGVLPDSRISTSHSNPTRRAVFESLGVKVLHQNRDVVEESDVVVFSVKPQVVKDVVLQLKPLLTKKKLLVSVAAGVRLKDLQEWAGHSRFVRVMPNTPAAVGEAASGDGRQHHKEEDKDEGQLLCRRCCNSVAALPPPLPLRRRHACCSGCGRTKAKRRARLGFGFGRWAERAHQEEEKNESV